MEIKEEFPTHKSGNIPRQRVGVCKYASCHVTGQLKEHFNARLLCECKDFDLLAG
jgi:hypothetical protein